LRDLRGSARSLGPEAAAGDLVPRAYEDKIPLNHNGTAPAIIAGIGYQFDRFNVQLNVLGASGLMFIFGYDIFR